MIKLHSFSKAKDHRWSGGTTTELYIFPESTNYVSHEFKFRISTATIENETTTFTKLSGFNRILSVLEGELVIDHENKAPIRLKPFELDYFSGDDETRSIGLARDFNVIFSPSFLVNIQKIAPLIETKISKATDFLFLFSLNDRNTINTQPIGKYDLVQIKEDVIIDGGGMYFAIEISKKS